ncbi:MAG TPA: 16S rRNA (guanine(527)-N(7))-methyltransferase RsmG [Gammaproteobacteria bacterium]
MTDAEPTAAVVRARLAAAGFTPPAADVERLAAFLALLARWNRVYNLTGIRTTEELVNRHLAESLALAPLLRGRRIADVGTGAGLPGVPLAIVEPERQFTLIEPRAKRARFLRHVAAQLALGNVSVAQARAEDLRPEHPFDTVLARAVAPPAELLGMCRPLAAPGGAVLLLTTDRLAAELEALAAGQGLRRAAYRRRPGVRGSILLLERIE